MWTLGVDYGTGSWKMALLEDGAPRDLVALATMDEAVAYVRQRWEERPGLPITLPSGFGVPLMRLSEAGPAELFAMSLRKGDPAGDGLGLFLRRLQVAGVDGYCPPAVKLLPSAPRWRTFNRVDMGTSDKLCAAAYLIELLRRRDGVAYADLSFLSLEVGYAFTCWLVVRQGQIVDGVGGTGGAMGPRCRGAIDGELAYLHGFASKADIYGGGAHDLAALYGAADAERAFWEGLEMQRLALSAYYDLRLLVVSGRRRNEARARWAASLGDSLRILHDDDAGFEPALGGALLADGLEGGPHAALVERLGIREATGHPLDGIAWGSAASPQPDGVSTHG